MSTALVVKADLPPAPFQIADANFMAALAAIEAEVVDLKITDAESDQKAVDLQSKLTKTGVALNEFRLGLTRPLEAAQKAIKAAADVPLNRIELSKAALKQARVRYDDQQRRIREEQEKARQAEIARLDKIRLAELERLEEVRRAEAREVERIAKEADDRRIAEDKRIAAEKEAARLAGLPVPVEPEVLDFCEEEPPEPVKTETEKAIEALKFSPPVVAPVLIAPRPKGAYFKTTLRLVSTDPLKLPEQFVIRSANEKALRATFCGPWQEGQPVPSIPGAVFEVVKDSVTR